MLPQEKQVTSQQLSRQLAELGVPQDGTWYWELVPAHATSDGKEVWTLEVGCNHGDTIAALTCSELGEQFPGNFNGWYMITQKGLMGNVWSCTIKTMLDSESVKQFQHKQEAEARGLALKWLLENGYIDIKDL